MRREYSRRPQDLTERVLRVASLKSTEYRKGNILTLSTFIKCRDTRSDRSGCLFITHKVLAFLNFSYRVRQKYSSRASDDANASTRRTKRGKETSKCVSPRDSTRHRRTSRGQNPRTSVAVPWHELRRTIHHGRRSRFVWGRIDLRAAIETRESRERFLVSPYGERQMCTRVPIPISSLFCVPLPPDSSLTLRPPPFPR